MARGGELLRRGGQNARAAFEAELSPTYEFRPVSREITTRAAGA